MQILAKKKIRKKRKQQQQRQKDISFPDRESNPGHGGESAGS